jgi:hypothetical protein
MIDLVAAELTCGNGYDDVDYIIGGDRFGGDGGGDTRPDTGEFDDGPGVSTIRVLTVNRD